MRADRDVDERTKALRALRQMPRQNKADHDVCRLAIGPKGLRASPTKAHEITPNDGPGVTLATNVAKCSEEIVFGTERRRLIDMLRTMQNHGLSMQIAEHGDLHRGQRRRRALPDHAEPALTRKEPQPSEDRDRVG